MYGFRIQASFNAEEADRAVELLGAGRDLFELQHGRANGGGVDVGHHIQGATEGIVLVGRPPFTRRVLHRRNTCQPIEGWFERDAQQTWNNEAKSQKQASM